MQHFHIRKSSWCVGEFRWAQFLFYSRAFFCPLRDRVYFEILVVAAFRRTSGKFLPTIQYFDVFSFVEYPTYPLNPQRRTFYFCHVLRDKEALCSGRMYRSVLVIYSGYGSYGFVSFFDAPLAFSLDV